MEELSSAVAITLPDLERRGARVVVEPDGVSEGFSLGGDVSDRAQ